jgi:hypothetical protein
VQTIANQVNGEAGWAGTPGGVATFYAASIADAFASGAIGAASTGGEGTGVAVLSDHLLTQGDAYHLGARFMVDDVLPVGRVREAILPVVKPEFPGVDSYVN